MKTIIYCLSFFITVMGYANDTNKGRAPMETSRSGLDKVIETHLVPQESAIFFSTAECSVSTSGKIVSAEFGTFVATITVKGPCDASLAQKMREAIAAMRAEFK